MLIPQPISQDDRERGLRYHYRRDDLGPALPANRCLICDSLLPPNFHIDHALPGKGMRRYCVACSTWHGETRKQANKRLRRRRGVSISIKHTSTALLMVLFSVIITWGQGSNIGSVSSPVVNRGGVPIPGANIAICQPVAITGASVTSDIGVFTLASTTGFKAGMSLLVSGFTGSDTYLNAGTLTNGSIVGGWIILSVTPTTLTFSINHANATATSTGTVLQEGNSTTACAGLVTVYADPGLVNTTANPFQSDQLGNWNVFAASGVYYVQFYASPLTTTLKEIVVNCPPNASASGCGGGGGGGGSINGNIANAQVAFGTGTNTIGGSNLFKWDNVNNILSLNSSTNGVAVRTQSDQEIDFNYQDLVSPVNNVPLFFTNQMLPNDNPGLFAPGQTALPAVVFYSPVELFGAIGGIGLNGRFVDTIMRDAPAPTVTHSGAGSTGSPLYSVVCIDLAGGLSLPSPFSSDPSGYPLPNSSNSNTIGYRCPVGYSNAAVLVGNTSTWIVTSAPTVISGLKANCGYGATPTGFCYFTDTGQARGPWGSAQGATTPPRTTTADTATAGALSDFEGFSSGGGQILAGYTYTQMLADPAALTLTVHGSPGSTTYSYYQVCHDFHTGVSNVSPVATVSNGPSSLSGSNYISISGLCYGSTYYQTVDILRGDTLHSIVTGLNPVTTNGAGTVVNDTGLGTSAYVPPIRNTTADINIGGQSFFQYQANFIGPVGFNNPVFVNPTGAATSGMNYPSYTLGIAGDYFNSMSMATEDLFSVSDVLGTGTNPTARLTWVHTGTGGSADILFDFPVALGTVLNCGTELQTNSLGDMFCGASAPGPTLATNGTNNTSQSVLNISTSATNTLGLTATPSNPSGGIVREEIGGTPSGTWDFSGVTAFKLPTAASFTATSLLQIGIDSSTNNIHFYLGADLIGLTAHTPGSWVNGDCASIYVNSSFLAIQDNGSACGSGGSSIFTSYKFGNQTAITGTANYVQTTYPSMFTTTQTGSGTSGSPYTDAITLTTQNANTVLAGPTSGGAATPTFQTAPTISAANMTNFPTFNQNTTGNSATATAEQSAGSVCASSQAASGVGTTWNAICVTLLGAQYGGTGINSSGSTGVAQVSGGGWSVSTALANGTTATTQMAGDNTTKVATDAFVVATAITNPMTALGDMIYGGASGVATRLAGPTGPNSVPQFVIDTPSAGAATAEQFALAGVPIDAQTGTTYTIAATDRASFVITANSSAIATTLPQAGSTGFTSNFPFVTCNNLAGTNTITPTTSTISSWTGSSYVSGATSFTLTTGQCAFIYTDNTNYFAIRFGGSGGGGGNTTSTSLTTNHLSKANGANSIIDSTLIDNGSTVTTVEPFVSGGTGTLADITTGTINQTIEIYSNSTSSATAPSPGGTGLVDIWNPAVNTLQTFTNCSNSASPATCGSSPSGVVAVPTGTNPTLVIDTSAVTTTSRIMLSIDESAVIAGVTCNTTLATLVQPVVTARTAGTSFTIQIGATLATNPACVEYWIVN